MPKGSFGERLQATIAYLGGRFGISHRDIAEVMEVFGVRRVGRYSLRMFLAKALTVEWAARIHRGAGDGS